MDFDILKPKYLNLNGDIEDDNKLSVLNQLSNNFKLTINDGIYSKEYSDLLVSNHHLIDSFEASVPKFNLETDQIVDLSRILTPVSATIANMGGLVVKAEQGLELGALTGSMSGSVKSIFSLNTEILKEQQNHISDGLVAVKGNIAFDTFLDKIEPATYMISNGLSQIADSFPISILQAPVIAPSLEEIKKEIYSESDVVKHQKILDDILVDIDPLFVEFRRGCWDAFKTKGRDYIGQATSSMRRLVEHLLEKLAPEEEVKKTNYFMINEEAKTEKGRPTRRAKLYYLMGYEKDRAEKIKRLADSLLASYDNLPALDHRPSGRDDFIQGILITIEGLLLSLLDRWREIK